MSVKKNEKIVSIQQWLNQFVKPSPNLTVTGKIDKPTVAALKKFQAAHHLKADGKLTTATWSAVGREVAPSIHHLNEMKGLPFSLFRLLGGVPSGAFVINRQDFFGGYMAHFGGLTGSQMTGLDRLLSFIEDDPAITDIRWVAYMLVTVQLECDDTWYPIEEHGCHPKTGCTPIPGNSRSYGHPYACPGDLHKVKDNKGVPLTAAKACPAGAKTHTYYGRGYVQITFPANYKALGVELGLGEELLHKPERVLEPTIAYQIMSVGMRKGLFTGRKLSDYIHGKKCDYFHARRIINAIPKKKAGIARIHKFEHDAHTIEAVLNLSLER